MKIVIIGYLLSFSLSIFPFFHPFGTFYGEQLIFCWIRSNELTATQFLIFDWVVYSGLVWISLIFLMYCHCKNFQTLKNLKI